VPSSILLELFAQETKLEKLFVSFQFFKIIYSQF